LEDLKKAKLDSRFLGMMIYHDCFKIIGTITNFEVKILINLRM